MSCTSPSYALLLGTDPETGKKRLKFLPRRAEASFEYWSHKFGAENILSLPCGKCDSCIEGRTRAWAARCVLESSMYSDNCFLTLTYADSCLPKFGLCKKDLQKFIKRLRKAVGHPIRYYCCGEYGEKTKRPHYHLIIFNWFPDDAKFFRESPNGGMTFTSKTLQSLWKFGHSLIGEVSYQSCAYVARYCQKKVYIDGKYKAFSLMSLKPGIGQKFFEDNLEAIYDTDKVYFNFGSSSWITPFRYFDKLLERIDPSRLESLKNERVSSAKLSIASDMLRLGLTHIEELYEYKGTLKSLKMDRLKRKDV